jgi:hypothetical protein
MLKPFTIFTFLIFIFIAKLSFSQNKDFEAGYIIEGKDTIAGLILRESESNLSKSITFKKSTTEEPHIYSPYELRGYSFSEDSLHFESIDYSTSVQDTTAEKRFAKVLLKGVTDLYKLRLNRAELPPIYLHENDFVLVLRKEAQYITLGQYEELDGNLYTLKKKYTGLLRALLSDCPKLEGYKYDQLPFDEEKIIKLVSEYNACNGLALPTRAYAHKVKPQQRKGVELIIGTVLPVSNKDLKNARIVGLGYFWDIFRKDANRKASSTLGLTYVNLQYDYFSFQTYNSTIYEKIKEHALLFPFHHQINLGSYKSKNLPFVYGGFTASLYTNYSFEYLNIVPLIDLGAGAYIDRIKVSATLGNAGFSLKSEKLVNLSIGWRFK